MRSGALHSEVQEAENTGLGDVGEAVGQAMRAARARLGLSQRELAERLGWDRAKVGRWEAGDLPAAVDAVQGVLRVLGFQLEVVPIAGLEGGAAPGVGITDLPVEHVRDRGGRRFPAHLEVVESRGLTGWLWSRTQGEVNPLAHRLTFVRRPRVVSESEALAIKERQQRAAERARQVLLDILEATEPGVRRYPWSAGRRGP